MKTKHSLLLLLHGNYKTPNALFSALWLCLVASTWAYGGKGMGRGISMIMSGCMPMMGAMGGGMPMIMNGGMPFMMGGAVPIMDGTGGTLMMTSMGGIPIVRDMNGGIKGDKRYVGMGMVLGMDGGMNGGMVTPMIGGGINGIGGMILPMMKGDMEEIMMTKMGRGMVEMQMMGGGMPMMGIGMPLMGGEMPMMLNGFGGMPQIRRIDGMSIMGGTGGGKGKY